MDPRIDELKRQIRDIPDFPKPGILFKDITPLLGHGPSLHTTTDLLVEHARRVEPTLVVGIESRGFIFGAPVADRLGIGMAPVRKPGKLPHKTAREQYALEYGTDALEMHVDAVAGHRVIVVDDVLATGGTAAATARLVEKQGGTVVGCLFVIELGFLGGRGVLETAGRVVESLIVY